MFPELISFIEDLDARYASDVPVRLLNVLVDDQKRGIHFAVFGVEPHNTYNWRARVMCHARGFTDVELAQLYGFFYRPPVGIVFNPQMAGRIPIPQSKRFETFIGFDILVSPEFAPGYVPVGPDETVADTAVIRYQSAPGEEVEEITLA